jgi:hypothetical protein
VGRGRDVKAPPKAPFGRGEAASRKREEKREKKRFDIGNQERYDNNVRPDHDGQAESSQQGGKNAGAVCRKGSCERVGAAEKTSGRRNKRAVAFPKRLYKYTGVNVRR